MIRRLLLLCALVALATQNAYGLGLGKLELKSALNQRFSAEIELTNTRGLENEEILPALASQADFDRAGIDRNYLLTDLRFKVVTRGSRRFVEVTSSKPIVEPFLNFLVEVLWPSGRILREYTVLLDPPVFGQQGVEALNAPQAQPAEPMPAPKPAPRQAMAAPKPTQPMRPLLDEGSLANGEYGMTGPGDTLWAIAAKVRPDGSVTVQQMMLAIQRANPDAFINDNINLLKAGHVLRIPDAAEIKRESVASAVREVRTQNEEFEAYRSGGQVTQMDASSRKPASGASGSGNEDGELRLLASDSGSQGERAGDSGNNGKVAELTSQLAVAQEDLDRARRANTELNSRVADIEGQIETLNEIVKLKDDQLAALRAEVQRLQSAQGSAATPAPSPAAQSGSLLTNPYVLGGLLLILIGAAAGFLYVRNKRQSQDVEEEAFEPAAAPSDVVDDDVPEVAAAPVEVEEEEEELSPQTSDVISEVEIYIAYGRFPQAITFLQNAIEAEPDRADIQLKLLEVYVQTEDATAFNLQFEQLRALGDQVAIDQALALQKRIPGAAEAAAASMDATVVSSEPITPIDAPDDDDDLSFDLDDLDAETEEDSLTLSDDIDLDDAEEFDLDLDLDLEADSSEEEIDLDTASDNDATVALEPTAGEGDELDLDDGEIELSLDDDEMPSLDDIDLGLDEAPAAASDDDAEDEISFDLEDDEISLDLEDDGEISLDLDDDGALDLSDDSIALDLEEEAKNANADTVELSLDDDAIELDLDGDDDAFELDLDATENDTVELELETAAGDAELSLDADDDDAIELNLDDDIELDLSDDDLSLDLDEDASTKLDLARAYIDMGDSDGARNVLQEVLAEGNDAEVQEANELLAKIG
ncbi:MAG: FimV family protein [Pseudomonadales bacterium]|nr:FimV family protein [Pseudomonadales bacterium]